MGKDTTIDREHLAEDDRGYRVKAAEKKAARKKAAKKTTRKKGATAKKKAATAGHKAKVGKPAAEPAAVTEAAPVAAQPQPAFTPPSDDTRSGSAMRGIVALWGPLAIILLLVVVSRLGDEDPAERGAQGVAGLSSSLETAERVAREVVEDVQDALTGGDPRAAVVLGAGASGQASSGSASGDLAAAFDDAGVTAGPAGPAPAPPTSAADPWAPSAQTTIPASVSGIPGALPPRPENPWAPVDRPVVAAVPAVPYPQEGVIPAPGAGYDYGAYPPPPRGYPPLPPGYASAPSPYYGERPPAYTRQPAYGAPPAYGVPPAYSYPPQPYGTPEPYPPGYYSPPQ